MNTLSSLTFKRTLSKYTNSAGVAVNVNLTPTDFIEAHTYCDNIVRKHDYDNYLCKFFYPRSYQKAYIALRALNIEIASVQELVSKPIIGQMRMQFWKDSIDTLFDSKPTKQPAILALYDSIRDNEIVFTKSFFKRIITSRETQLQEVPLMKISDVESYSQDTASMLLCLQLEILGLRDHNAEHAASHFGKTIGIAILIRSLPFHASRRRMVIPVEITAKHQVSQEDVFQCGPAAKNISDAVFEFATIANDHLQTAKSYAKEAPKSATPAFLSAIWAENYLKRLEKLNFDAFHSSLQLRDWRLPFKIFSRSRK